MSILAWSTRWAQRGQISLVGGPEVLQWQDVPDVAPALGGGREGLHTEHLGHMLSEMQIVARSQCRERAQPIIGKRQQRERERRRVKPPGENGRRGSAQEVAAGGAVTRRGRAAGGRARRAQNSMRAPSSSTRSEGIPKKSVAELAFHDMNAKTRLRHRAIGAGPSGIQ